MRWGGHETSQDIHPAARGEAQQPLRLHGGHGLDRCEAGEKRQAAEGRIIYVPDAHTHIYMDRSDEGERRPWK